MKNLLIIAAITVLTTSAITACSDKDNEIEIPLSEVPANIITAVQNTLPGISLTEAEKEVEHGIVVYELEGVLLNGKQYEIKIEEDGTIISVELED